MTGGLDALETATAVRAGELSARKAAEAAIDRTVAADEEPSIGGASQVRILSPYREKGLETGLFSCLGARSEEAACTKRVPILRAG